MPSVYPIHDFTEQGKFFGYVSTLLSDTSRLTYMAGASQLLTWGKCLLTFRPKYELAALDAATGLRNFLTRSRASQFYTSRAAAPRARPTGPHREGRADCGADRSAGAGWQTDRDPGHLHRRAGRPYRSARSAARRTDPPPAENPRQLIEAALARTKTDPRPPAADRPPRKSRPGVAAHCIRTPDRTIDRRLTTCPKCEAVFPETSQTPQQVYERIELPPVRPEVTQIRLFGGRCECCGERVTADATVRSGAGIAVRPLHRGDGGLSLSPPLILRAAARRKEKIWIEAETL